MTPIDLRATAAGFHVSLTSLQDRLEHPSGVAGGVPSDEAQPWFPALA